MRHVCLAILLVAGCKPIQTQHAFKLDYPRERSDLTLRFLPAPSGHVALWITTSDDLEENGRYEGVHFVLDPGSPEDVEKALLPALPDGLPIAYVVVTTPDAQAAAGARRLAKDHVVNEIVAPIAPGPGKQRAETEYLKLGGELTARLVRPSQAQGVAARAFLLRFIDVQILALPAEADDAWAKSIAEDLERQGLHSTAVWSPRALQPETIEALEAEAIVGPSAGELAFQTKDALTLKTNGAEITAPGPVTRSRYGHWIDCSAKPEGCGAELSTAADGPLRVTMTVGGTSGTFLLDTRAPLSFLAKPIYDTIPGASDVKSHGGHSHGGGSIGLEVPPFKVGDMEVRNWHVLPVEPFDVGGKPIAGVLGMDFLQSFKITWEPKAKSLRLSPNFAPPRERLAQKAEEASGAWTIPMDRSPAGPLILATLDGRPASLVVDLASEQTAVYLQPEEFAMLSDARPATRWYFDVPDDVDDAQWRKKEVRAASLPVKDLNLFGAHFPDTKAVGLDRPMDTDVLGLDFLSTFNRVSMDFRERSLTLTR